MPFEFIMEYPRPLRETRQVIGRQLRQAREARGLTQREVATHLGLHREAVTEMEAGRRRVQVEEFLAMATLYEVRLSDLLTEVMEGERCDRH